LICGKDVCKKIAGFSPWGSCPAARSGWPLLCRFSKYWLGARLWVSRRGWETNPPWRVCYVLVARSYLKLENPVLKFKVWFSEK